MVPPGKQKNEIIEVAAVKTWLVASSNNEELFPPQPCLPKEKTRPYYIVVKSQYNPYNMILHATKKFNNQS